MFDYPLASSEKKYAPLSELVLLYGGNGAGKTTILKLVFAALNGSRGQGHRGLIGQTPFKEFILRLSSGAVIEFRRTGDALLGDYTIEWRASRRAKPKSISIVTEPDNSVNGIRNSSLRAYLAFLASLNLDIILIPDDRQIQSTLDIFASGEVSSEDEEGSIRFLSRVVRARIRHGDFGTSSDAHHLEVEPIIRLASAWARSNALKASSDGEDSAHQIYARVIDGRAHPKKIKDEVLKDKSQLRNEVSAVSLRAEDFSKRDLLARFPADGLLKYIWVVERSYFDLGLGVPFLRD